MFKFDKIKSLIKPERKPTKFELDKLDLVKGEMLAESVAMTHTARAPWNRDQRHAKADALRMKADNLRVQVEETL